MSYYVEQRVCCQDRFHQHIRALHVSKSRPAAQGSARDAARKFPKNSNIAAAMAMCTVGLDAAQVRALPTPRRSVGLV